MRSTGGILTSVLVTVLLVCLFIPTAWASPLLSEYDKMECKSTDNNLKPWTIKFSSPVQVKELDRYLRITDDNNQNIPTRVTWSDDQTEVTLTPLSPYTWGKEYRVYVDGTLQSAGGVFLNQAVVMPYSVNEPQNYVTNITHQQSTFTTTFNITCRTGVYSVKINETNAHYRGGNKYECYVAGLVTGNTVFVKAYDNQGSLLETQQYVVL